MAWRLLEDWESTSSKHLEGSTVYSLEFADKPMLLVSVGEEFSIDLEQKSIVQVEEDLIQLLD